MSFVVALTLLVRRRAALIATITAFTLAHSLSLAAATLDLVRAPVAPVEAAIALSVVLVCAECLRSAPVLAKTSRGTGLDGRVSGERRPTVSLRPADSLIRRAPWLVAFAFGLLHGLGFASALLAVGLPEGHLPLALGCFNVGVELGQLGVVLLLLVARRAVSRFAPHSVSHERALVYAMGAVAAFWCLERLPAVFGS